MALLTDEQLLSAYRTMKETISARERSNTESLKYYSGKIRVENLRIAIPVELEKLEVVSDWPTTVINSYHERMVFLGWRDQGKYNMRETTYLSNATTAVWEALLDAKIFGLGLVAVDRTPSGVWKSQPVSPLEGSLIWDATDSRPMYGMRTRELFDGTKQDVLYVPYYTIYLKQQSSFNTVAPEVMDVVYTGMPVPLMFRFRNHLRSNQWYGRSMLTRPIRYYTQAAARTLMGMEYNREFYTAPKWYVVNANNDVFTESDNPSERERRQAGWKATTGSVLTLPPPEIGEPKMEVGQFQANPPTPYVEQLNAYGQKISSATGIPVSYLGFTTENPPSADAIRAWMERLVRSCQAQQRLTNPDLAQLGWVLHSLNNDSLVEWREFATSVHELWENPATPTLSSDADAVTKLIDAGVTGATSDWVYDRLQISESEREDFRTAQRAQALRLFANRAQQEPPVTDTATELSQLTQTEEM